MSNITSRRFFKYIFFLRFSCFTFYFFRGRNARIYTPIYVLRVYTCTSRLRPVSRPRARRFTRQTNRFSRRIQIVRIRILFNIIIVVGRIPPSPPTPPQPGVLLSARRARLGIRSDDWRVDSPPRRRPPIEKDDGEPLTKLDLIVFFFFQVFFDSSRSARGGAYNTVTRLTRIDRTIR